jgi:hypothetical protein
MFYHSSKMLSTPRILHKGDDHDRLQTVSLLAHMPFSASVVTGIDALYDACFCMSCIETHFRT